MANKAETFETGFFQYVIDLGWSIKLAHLVETIIEILTVLVKIKTNMILGINTPPIISKPNIITTAGQLEG